MNSLGGKKMLVTRPEHDPGTRYLSRWSESLIEDAEGRGMQVIDLFREKANAAEFTGRLDKADPSLVVLNGHGSDTSVTGHDNKPLVSADGGQARLKGRITYAVSCNSAAVLGPSCGDERTAYIGYAKSFIFNINRQYLTRPKNDARAGRFLTASNRVVESLLSGHTAAESSARSKAAFLQQILALLSSSSTDPDDRDDMQTLLWDMKHQVCCGNGDMTL
jgi:hypothetical protein